MKMPTRSPLRMPRLTQRGGQAVGLGGHFPVGGCFTLEDQAGAFRAQPGGFIQEMEDRHGGIVEVVRHAGIVMGEPGTEWS